MGKIKSKKYNGVYLYHLKDNDISYYITYKDQNNKKIWLKIGKKSNGITEVFCYQKRTEIINQITLGEQPTALKRKAKKDIITLDKVATLYFESMKKKSTQRSIQDRKSKYNKHLKPLHSKDIVSITKNDLIKIQSSLYEKKYALQTINSIIELFSTIYNFGLKEELYSKNNPASKVERFKINNKRERYLSKDEIKKLYNEIKDNKLLTLFVKVALITGARIESILDIQKKDIDFNNETITINDFKTKDTYNGFMDKELHTLLEEECKKIKANDYILSIDNKKLTKRQIQQRLKPILDKLFNSELDKRDTKNRVVIHTLRHTFASHLAINGTSIYKIQKLMNHKDINVTARYAKLSPDSGKSDIQRLYL